MSKIALTPNASGTGTFTIAAPDSNTDRTLTLPDSTGTLATLESIPAGYTDTDALDLFNATGSAPVYACRAWVNFNGTGTVAIRASGNVSSITDNGVGAYSVNLTTALADTNAAVVATRSLGATNGTIFAEMSTTSKINISTKTDSGSAMDVPNIHVAVFR